MTRTGYGLLFVTALLVTASGLVLYDLSHSNRPHELRFVPAVTALAALSLIVSLGLVVHTRPLLRGGRQPTPSPGTWLVFGLSLAYVGASVFLLLVAVGTLLA